MIKFDAKVIDIIKRTTGVKSFRFDAQEADFKAGQFFFVTIEVGGEERTKHFSFSNSPTEKNYVEFTKRMTRSAFSNALDALKISDKARLKMSLGSFVLDKGYNKIAFLSGGIGITPIRSMCKFATDMKLKHDMVLFYGNRREEDIIFKQDFDEMRSINKKFRVIYTLTSPEIDKNAWQGRCGHIDDKMIAEEMPDYKDRVFYICGPPRMVESLTKMLKEKLSVGEDKIKTENFTGY